MIPLGIYPAFDELTTSLGKLDALLKIGSSANITEFKAETIFHFFCAAEDMLNNAKRACDFLSKEIY